MNNETVKINEAGEVTRNHSALVGVSHRALGTRPPHSRAINIRRFNLFSLNLSSAGISITKNIFFWPSENLAPILGRFLLWAAGAELGELSSVSHMRRVHRPGVRKFQ